MQYDQPYYYGQGKVYLAPRLQNGKPGKWRWVGDVSALTIELAQESQLQKRSAGGQLYTAERYVTARTGTLSSTWYRFSPDNLVELLVGDFQSAPAQTEYLREQLDDIQDGDQISLAYQNVQKVSIEGLKEDIDYKVDSGWGFIEFIRAPNKQPFFVNYQYWGSSSLPINTLAPTQTDFYLRFEGVNLAEDRQSIRAELYRVSFDALSALALINNSDELNNLQITAQLKHDPSKQHDKQFGALGRLLYVPETVFSTGYLDLYYGLAHMSADVVAIHQKVEDVNYTLGLITASAVFSTDIVEIQPKPIRPGEFVAEAAFIIQSEEYGSIEFKPHLTN